MVSYAYSVHFGFICPPRFSHAWRAKPALPLSKAATSPAPHPSLASLRPRSQAGNSMASLSGGCALNSGFVKSRGRWFEGWGAIEGGEAGSCEMPNPCFSAPERERPMPSLLLVGGFVSDFLFCRRRWRMMNADKAASPTTATPIPAPMPA
jgi:hypothetical protein